MKIGKIKQIFLIALFLIILGIFVFLWSKKPALTQTSCQPHGLWGFAWAGIPQGGVNEGLGLGWISLSCENQGALVDYGVNVEPDGKLVGFAFFDMDDPNTSEKEVGWINFSPTETPPGPPYYSAKLDFTTGKITGWARACNVYQSGCSGNLKSDSERGGWDGWILLGPIVIGGTDYGVRMDKSILPNELRGWAWGGDVVGWISFNCKDPGICTKSNYKVYINSSPFAKICCQDCANENCVAYERELFTLINASSDPNGNSDIVRSEWDILNWGTSPDLVCTGSNALCNFTPTISRGNWTVSLKVFDQRGAFSTATKQFTILKNIVADFKCSLNENGPWENCPDLVVRVGDTVYFKNESEPSEGATLVSFNWTFEGGDPSSSNEENPSSTFVSPGQKSVTLQVTDSNGKQATQTYILNVKRTPTFYPLSP